MLDELRVDSIIGLCSGIIGDFLVEEGIAGEGIQKRDADLIAEVNFVMIQALGCLAGEEVERNDFDSALMPLLEHRLEQIHLGQKKGLLRFIPRLGAIISGAVDGNVVAALTMLNGRLACQFFMEGRALSSVTDHDLEAVASDLAATGINDLDYWRELPQGLRDDLEESLVRFLSMEKSGEERLQTLMDMVAIAEGLE